MGTRLYFWRNNELYSALFQKAMLVLDSAICLADSSQFMIVPLYEIESVQTWMSKSE